MKQPSGGFTNGDMAHLFSPNQSPTSSESGSPPATTTGPGTNVSDVPSSSNTGAIAGGIVGGIAGVALIALGLFLFRRRRNQRLAAAGVRYEVAGQPVVEKEGSTPRPDGEMLGDTQYPHAFPPAELSGGATTHHPHELSPANYMQESNRGPGE